MGSGDLSALKTQASGSEARNFQWFLRGGKTLQAREVNTAMSFWCRMLQWLPELSSSDIYTEDTSASLTLQSNRTTLKSNTVFLISKFKFGLTFLICNPQIS